MEATKSVTIPNRSLWPTLGLAIFLSFTCLQFVGYIIPGLMEFFKLRPATITLSDVGLIWVPMVGYILASANCLGAFYITKSQPLNSWSENGLTKYLLWSFQVSLLLGLSMGLVAMIFIVLADIYIGGLGLSESLIFGLALCFYVAVMSMILFLSISLIGAIIFGSIDEFS